MKALKTKPVFKKLISLAPILLVTLTVMFAGLYYSSAQATNSNSLAQVKPDAFSTCGGSPAVSTTINFGCSHSGNPINALLFAVVKFLTAGVGLLIIMSVIIGGIQYIVSRGDPNATSKAVNRLVSAVIALFLYIFAYAILSYIIPQGFFVK